MQLFPLQHCFSYRLPIHHRKDGISMKTKRLFIIAMAAVMLTGCASQQSRTTESGAADAGAKSEIVTIGQDTATDAPYTAPPLLMLEAVQGEIASAYQLPTGSYSWNYDNGDGTAAGAEACRSIPGLMGDNILCVVQAGAGAEVHIILPKGAQLAKAECWQGTQTQAVDFTEDGYITLPAQPIGDIYSLTVRFDGAEYHMGENGSCEYIFRTTDKPIDYTIIDDENPTEGSTFPYDPAAVDTVGSIVSFPPQYTQKPPELTAEIFTANGDFEAQLTQCGYAWYYTDDNGSETAIIADCPLPYQLDLKPICTVAADDKVCVNLTDGGRLAGALNWSAEGKQLALDYQRTGEIYIPADLIGDIFSLTVEFPQGECTYVFAAANEAASADEVAVTTAVELTKYPCDITYSSDVDEEIYDGITVIDSAEKLSGFADQLDESRYNADFFKDSALIIAYFTEGSGSVKLSFEGVSADGEVVVRREIPEIGTCDMAYYRMVIEIPQEIAHKDFRIVCSNVNI